MSKVIRMTPRDFAVMWAKTIEMPDADALREICERGVKIGGKLSKLEIRIVAASVLLNLPE
jgi:hypothetical protein